jgi:hypothetical protein
MSDEPKSLGYFLIRAALFVRSHGSTIIAFAIAAIFFLIAAAFYCITLPPGGWLERERIFAVACGLLALSNGFWQLRQRRRPDPS